MIDYPNKLEIIFDKLNIYDIKPIIVGGYVRDYFLGIHSKDIDIELYNVSSFEKLQEILSEFGNTNIIGKNYGVIKLKVDDLDVDFSLPRTDSKVSSGHRGFEINTSKVLNFKTASFRRDFTINSIGYDIFSKKILDPYNGIHDLKNKSLKYVDENSFIEDPLRVLRAMQFCARFKLVADTHLISSCKEMIHKNTLDELPHERIYEEFKKLFLKADKPSIGLNFLQKIDAYIFFHEFNMDANLWKSTLYSIDLFCTKNKNNTNIVILLALLCYEIDEKNKVSLIYKLTNKKNIIKEINSFIHVAKYLQNNKHRLLYRIMKDIDLESLKLFLESLGFNNENIKYIKPVIHGKNIIDLGIKPSKEFNDILQKRYEEQIDNLNLTQ